MPDGAEGEYAAAARVDPGSVPLDLWEADRPVETRADAASTPPATTGVNLAAIQPYVFSGSIAQRLGIAMPTVGTGTHGELTITTPLTAGAKAKGAAVESTAAELTAVTATPRRISARLSLQAEDIALVGTDSYEPALRENLSAALSDQYDAQCINGDGQAPNVNGLRNQLTRPTNPTAVADFDLFLAAVAAQIDGLWARTLRDVVTLVNPETYRLSVTKFRDGGNAHKGAEAASAYLSRETGGWSAAARLPTRRHPARTPRSPMPSSSGAGRRCVRPCIRSGDRCRSMTSTRTAPRRQSTSPFTCWSATGCC